MHFTLRLFKELHRFWKSTIPAAIVLILNQFDCNLKRNTPIYLLASAVCRQNKTLPYDKLRKCFYLFAFCISSVEFQVNFTFLLSVIVVIIIFLCAFNMNQTAFAPMLPVDSQFCARNDEENVFIRILPNIQAVIWNWHVFVSSTNWIAKYVGIKLHADQKKMRVKDEKGVWNAKNMKTSIFTFGKDCVCVCFFVCR